MNTFIRTSMNSSTLDAMSRAPSCHYDAKTGFALEPLALHPVYASRPSAITLLNADCLSLIFQHLSDAGDINSVINASHVNVWMRTIALSTASIWNRLQWSQTIAGGPASGRCFSTAPTRHRMTSQAAFLGLLARSGGTDLYLTFQLHRDATRANSGSLQEALATLYAMAAALSHLQSRVVELTLDVQCHGLVELDVALPLELPRLQRLNLCRTDPRLIAFSGGMMPAELSSLAYHGGGCGFWSQNLSAVAGTLRTLEVQAVVHHRGDEGASLPWMDTITHAFPTLERVKVWESLQESGDWSSFASAVAVGRCKPTQPHRLKSLDIRRLAMENLWPAQTLNSLRVHEHVGLHGIQQATEFAHMLPSGGVAIQSLRIRGRLNAELEDLPFHIAPALNIVYAIEAHLADGKTRMATTLNRRCVEQCVLHALALPHAQDLELELDGPDAWDVVKAVRSVLHDVVRLSLRVQLAVELRLLGQQSSLDAPALRSLILLAPLGSNLNVSDDDMKSVLQKFTHDRNVTPDLFVLGMNRVTIG
ncbi:hypothetical protein BKA62DRAFT_710896 [Auriculariales sp. MPI-PUGE-AT-0066]|nr:hypothetical protein BKA62DRAFT_710896 [Auriculariales sp. MPI-PUGE-AT-0066]